MEHRITKQHINIDIYNSNIYEKKKNDTHCSKNLGNWKRKKNAYDNGKGEDEMKDYEDKKEREREKDMYIIQTKSKWQIFWFFR